MRRLSILALAALLSFCSFSCMYGYRPSYQQEAAVSSQEEERVEEIESTEKKTLGPWHAK